jgi:hypothetical protein
MRTLLDMLGAAPAQQQQPQTMLAGLGQRYQDYPAASFDQRFGPYNTGPVTDRDMIRRLFEQEQFRQIPEAITPGSELIDPLGHRGTRHPSGYYLLRGI